MIPAHTSGAPEALHPQSEGQPAVIDLVIVLMLVLCATWGVLRGGLFHLMGIVALIFAWLFSSPLAPLVGGLILSKTQWSEGASLAVGRLVAFFLIYVGLMGIGTFIDYRFRKIKSLSLQGLNRGLGGVFGFIWGGVLCFLLLCLGDVWLKVYPDTGGYLAQAVRESRLRSRVTNINPADRFLVTDTLRLLRAAREEPELLEELRAEPHVKSMIEHPDFVALSNDAGLQQAIQDRDYAAVLKNENLRAVLENDELRAALLSAEMRETIRQVLEGWEPAPASPEGDEPAPEE
jgi:uncharacterized membrane protein required for colicin V production